MNTEYKHLAIRSIDLTDTTFVTTYGFALTQLKKSIEKIGILNPPLVKKKSEEQYSIVCGYKRLLVCHEIGIEELRCAIMCQSIEDKDTFLISLYDNLSHRVLNPVEKSITISKLQKYYSVEVIVKKFLPLLGLNSHYSVLDRIKPLSSLDVKIKDAVVDGRIDEGVAAKFLNFSKKDREPILQILSTLRFSKNKQNEIIDNLYDITKRDGCSAYSILNAKELKDILADSNLNIPQKGSRVRYFLRKLKYPKIIKAENDFLEMKGKLNFGDKIRLTPPPSFEGDRYCIEFLFENMDDLEDSLKKIDSAKHNKEFKRIIEG
ncbi:MAG: ParB/RepB/Spo0J family partition protein [Thermodesulfobacteriota bacterium]